MIRKICFAAVAGIVFGVVFKIVFY